MCEIASDYTKRKLVYGDEEKTSYIVHMVSGQLFNRVVIIPLSPHTPPAHTPHSIPTSKQLCSVLLLWVYSNDPICTIHTV